jgi:hypothetical protein
MATIRPTHRHRREELIAPYACAKAHGAELLFKGDDFAHTDVARA